MIEKKIVNYKIIASGSSGNCVIINDVMIDCGVPYLKIKEYLYEIRYLLLTHVHSDHIKITTLKRISKEFPKIKIIGNYEIYQTFGQVINTICNEGFDIVDKRYKFIPFLAEHDVICYGYTWWIRDKHVIYCTDTCSLENAPKEDPFDYLFLESNYDDIKLEQANHKKYGYDVMKAAHRHLSTKQCKAFYYMYRRNKESKLIELHKSSKFY